MGTYCKKKLLAAHPSQINAIATINFKTSDNHGNLLQKETIGSASLSNQRYRNYQLQNIG